MIYRVSFLTGPAQKSHKYETGPTQQQKVAKYTGPTKEPNVGKVFNKQFLSLKKYQLVLQEKHIITWALGRPPSVPFWFAHQAGLALADTTFFKKKIILFEKIIWILF